MKSLNQNKSDSPSKVSAYGVEPGHDDERPSHDTEKGRKLRALIIYAVALADGTYYRPNLELHVALQYEGFVHFAGLYSAMRNARCQAGLNAH